MAAPGFYELLIIGAILLGMVAIPIAIVVVVVILLRNNKPRN